MRDTVRPATRTDRILAALGRLDGNGDAAVIERHAHLINQAWVDLIGSSYTARGFDIGCDNDSAYARPRSKTVGIARELANLAPKCRKASDGKISLRDWATLWAAQPHRIQKLWKPKLIKTPEGRTIDRTTVVMSFAAAGYVMNAPKPEIVLPIIEAALAKITASPRSKKRELNAVEAKAIEAIRAAYKAITGNEGGRVINIRGKLDGKLAALGREIDGFFSTKLIAKKDSWRLRRLP